MEEALSAFLLASAGLSALVGTRVDWSRRPQAGALPSIILHQISAPRTYTMTGRDALMGQLVQIDCWGVSFKSAKDTARAVAAVLETPPPPEIRAFFIENERTDLDPGESGSIDLYRTSLDVRVWTITA